MAREPNQVSASYDTVAAGYADRFRRELDHKPFDRYVLDRFAERAAGRGTVCDVGCGPGQISGYLAERGVAVCGVDLSPEMIARAREANPGTVFAVGDMRRLDARNGAWVGISSFYSIIHIEREAVTDTLREFERVLEPGGHLLLAFHLRPEAGDGTVHLEEWFDAPVDLDFHFFEREEMASYLRDAGFAIEQVRERDPYPGVEADTRRAYFLSRKSTE